MSDLSEELSLNAAAFRDKWTADITDNISNLSNDGRFLESYSRIAALQAIKSWIVGQGYSSDAVCFYAEAQNDALASHVFASMGAWRASLQSLRSSVENMLGSHFFNDHPVEFRLWSKGTYKLGFTDTVAYFSKHPDLEGIEASLSGIEILKQEYSTLSKAVHGSAVAFRMTDSAARLLLWSTDPARLGAWSTRQKKVIEGLALLAVCLHHEKLAGTAMPQLRSMLGYAISDHNRAKLKARLHIIIEKPS